MRITVLGGDKRSIKLVNLLKLDEHIVKVYGFDEENVSELLVDNLQLALTDADLVIGPIPCTRDEVNLNTPMYSNKIRLDEIFKFMKSNGLFVAGKIPKTVFGMANNYDIKAIDILGREEMAVLNAIPTVEGAIEIAMKERDTTLHGSNIMVLGFGRIGKLLGRAIYGMGTIPYIEARKHSDLAWIEAYGYFPVPLMELSDYLPKMDIIFNTIPQMILDEKNLKLLNKNTLIIDLASEPGGVNFEKADEFGIRTIWALGLPGKVASETAAKIIKTTIYNIVKELGE